MKDILKGKWQELLKDEFEKPYYLELRKLLIAEYRNFDIYPPAEDIFNAFKYTPYEKVKVVILGQDPYHNPGQAHGLAFSVRENVEQPPSLKNIFKELHDDLGCEIPKTGSLIPWAKEGVMLLNTTLTVRRNDPMSHSKIGWEIFTDRVIELLDQKKEPVVFILWGGHARSKKKLIKNHFVVESAHPSPLSAYRGFFGSKPFSKTNNYLKSQGLEPVNWEIK